ncbi:MAG TPA: hypothetical protein VKR22_08390 [Acidimicrobiales bacterium]|nr:hypothetical protein [Acidimicrobiales bacterium]
MAVSHDEGATFEPIHPVPQLPGPDHSSGIETIALPGGSNVVAVGSEGGVQTSLDWGATWTTTIPQPTKGTSYPSALLGFESLSAGHVDFPANEMWTTADGGRTWTPFQFP